MDFDQKTFTIQEVSEYLGLPKSTLRFWEKAFEGCILPQRTAGGQRRYGAKDMALLEMISDLKKQGLPLTAIKRELALHRLSNNGLDAATIDLLANRIAGAVQREVINFFKKET